jgi:exportin-5
MTKQPSRINHPNIHHVVYFLTLLPRQRARADAKADESVCRRRSAPLWMFFFSNLTRLFFSNPTRDVAFRRLTRFSRRPQIHFAAAMRCAEAGNVAGGKAHSAAVSAALGAAATYAEWAPLAPLFRSGLLDACGHFLSAAEFRAPACEVLRHVAHRRRGDVVNSVLNTSGKSKETNASSEADLAAQKEAAADAETVVVGFAAACRSLGAAAAAALAAPPADPGDEHRDYVVRLTETAAAIASNHLHVLPDAQLRVAFLEALLGLTKYPTLDTLGAAVAAWPGILRAAGAELPNGFVRPEEKIVNDPKERLTLPEGAVVALLETARHWLTRGGGVAAGLSASLCPEAAGDEWEQEYETRDELREVWVQHRARLMEITKLCTCLVPVAAANAAATRVAQTCALVQAGGALDQTKASQTPSVDASGRSALDDAAGAAFEGATSFVEPVMQALPFGDEFRDGSNLTASGTANTQVIAAIAPALDAMLSNALAVTLASPVGVSQMSRLLEALGRAALARPEAGAAILNRLFEILGHLPSDDAAAPPARAKAALMAGRTAQAARQRVCAAVLGVCTAAPQVRLRRSRMIVFFPVSVPPFFF